MAFTPVPFGATNNQGQVDEPVAVAPFVVVPAEDLTSEPLAMVSPESKVQLAGEPTMSELTIGSSVYTRTLASFPVVAAAWKA